MHRPLVSRYWLFQVIGWGCFALVNIAFALLADNFKTEILIRLLFFIETGIMVSHFMRFTIKRVHLTLKPVNQQILLLIVFTILFATLFSSIQTRFEAYYEYYPLGKKQVPFQQHFIYNLTSAAILLFIWNTI